MTTESHARGKVVRRTARAVAAAAAALMMAAGLAACGGEDGPSATEGGLTKIRVGTLPAANLAALHMGIKKGFFKDEGLDVQTQDVQSGADLITGAISGDFDFIAAGYVPAITAISKDLPIKIVAANDVGADDAAGDWQVVVTGKGTGITTAADLAGKTIATNALKGVGEVAVRASLEKQGLDPNSVTFTEVGFPDMPAALSEGRVDAAFIPEPFLSQVLAEGATVVDAPYPTLDAAFPNGGWSAGTKLISSDSDVVDKFVAAINKSLDYASAHPDEVRAAIPTFTKIPAEVAAEMRLPVFTSELDAAKLTALAGYAKDAGAIESVPSEGDLIHKSD